MDGGVKRVRPLGRLLVYPHDQTTSGNGPSCFFPQVSEYQQYQDASAEEEGELEEGEEEA